VRKAWLKKAQGEDLVAEYEAAAHSHGVATENGDYKIANKNADVVAKIYAELRSRGERELLLSLLVHESQGVRCWAGAHALDFAPQQGEPVLAVLAEDQRSLMAMSARVTLEEWRKGELKFP
jgi:hypothetical protein